MNKCLCCPAQFSTCSAFEQRFKMNYFVILLFVTVFSTIEAAVSTNQTNSTTTETTTTVVVKKLAKYTNDAIQYMTDVGSHCTDDGFFADRDDCRKFHVCYGGTQSVRWCKEGMLWDEIKIGCSMQNVTPCINGRKKWSRNDDSIASTTTKTTTMTSPTSNSAPMPWSRNSYTCRSGATGFFADPSSCSIYHWCVLGVLQSTHRCSSGLHFSASANGCLWPKDAECEGQIAPPYSPIDCASGSSGYFPDPYDCSVFHYCDGVKTQSESLLCSSGLVWNSRVESCAWPNEVAECQNACPANYSSQMRFADPVICSQYVQCVDGHLEQRNCPNNLLFDRITKTCKPYEQAECHGAKPDPLSMSYTSTTATTSSPFSNSDIGVIKKQRSTRFYCVADGYFGDSQDCRIYHVCVDGRDYRSMCAVGLAWESLLRLCLPANQVGCQASKSFDSSSSSAGSSKKKWLHSFTRPIARTTVTTTTSTTTTSTTPALPFGLPSIFTCAGRPNGYYPDPVHCHKFHYCATGWHSLMECEQGLAYSARDNDCVPFELADCATQRIKRKKKY